MMNAIWKLEDVVATVVERNDLNAAAAVEVEEVRIVVQPVVGAGHDLA